MYLKAFSQIIPNLCFLWLRSCAALRCKLHVIACRDLRGRSRYKSLNYLHAFDNTDHLNNVSLTNINFIVTTCTLYPI